MSFDFVFSLYLMRTLLAVTNELSKALQRKDQDIANAMNLVKLCKERMQMMRDDGWDSFLIRLCFCEKHGIVVPFMAGTFVHRGRSRRKAPGITNLHYFQVDLFYSVIDMQLQELNDRFNEVNTDLLLFVSCLCPRDSFFAFDKQMLIRLARYYPKDFSKIEHMILDDQLETYIMDMRSSDKFMGLQCIGELSVKMVETRRQNVYPLVYRLVTLSLILPVATATVERVFSAMKIVKNRLRNRMGDQWMSDSVYIEKDIFDNLTMRLFFKDFR